MKPSIKSAAPLPMNANPSLVELEEVWRKLRNLGTEAKAAEVAHKDKSRRSLGSE